MTAPVLAVVNPASAGGRTYARWPAMAAAFLRHGLDLDTHCTARSGDATAIVRDALRAGHAGPVVAVGGDGTLNEVVNGFFDERGDPIGQGASLGLVPSGTGGDFRRSAGIPAGADAAVALIASGATRQVDCGRIEFGDGTLRHVINIADCGLGGEVVARVNRSAHKGGGAAGTAMFLWTSLATLWRYASRPVRVTCDGVSQEHDAESVVVANGQWFGGGMRIAPDALLDDALFDVVIVESRGRTRSLLEIPSLYRGAHLSLRGVSVRRAADVRIEPLGGDTLFDVEGEQVGRAPARITCRPGALTLHATAGPALRTGP